MNWVAQELHIQMEALTMKPSIWKNQGWPLLSILKDQILFLKCSETRIKGDIQLNNWASRMALNLFWGSPKPPKIWGWHGVCKVGVEWCKLNTILRVSMLQLHWCNRPLSIKRTFLCCLPCSHAHLHNHLWRVGDSPEQIFKHTGEERKQMSCGISRTLLV